MADPFDPDAYLAKKDPDFNPDAYLQKKEEPGWVDYSLGIAKQLPLGFARGVGNMLTAGAPAGLEEAIANNPALYDKMKETGQQMPTMQDYERQKEEALRNIGINSPNNMPQNFPERVVSAAFESVPWSMAMGVPGMATNVGLGMVGGMAGEVGKEMTDDPKQKAINGAIGNIVGSLGAAGAMGVMKGLYNIFGAPYRRLPGEFNLPATRGMMEPEGSAARRQMLNEEQSLAAGSRGKWAAKVMAGPAAQRESEIQATRYNDFLGGEAENFTPQNAGEAVSGAIGQRARKLEETGNEIYDAARASNPTRIISEPDLPLPAIDTALKAKGIKGAEVLDQSFPTASRARAMIENLQDGLTNLPNETSPRNYKAQFNDMWQTLKDIRRLRASRPDDGEILSQVRDSYHGWMRKTLDNVLFTGDKEIIDNLAQADSIWRKLRMITNVDRRNPARDYTTITSGIINDSKTPEQVANYLTNIGSVDGASKALRFIRFMRNTFGEDSDAWKATQGSLLYKALMGDKPEKSGLELANSIRKLLNGPGAPVARMALSEDQRNRLAAFEQSLRQVTPKLSNPSGSGYESGRTLWHMALSALGVAEIFGAAHGVPIKYLTLGAAPLGIMANNARKAVHATRETMTGRGAVGYLPNAAVGAENGYIRGQEP